MTEYLAEFKQWIISLGEKHHVNPLILGSLYFVSKVTLVYLLAWIVKRVRAKKPVLVQILMVGISFCIPYSYLMIAGRDLPFWVYLFAGLVFTLGAYTIWRKVIAGAKEME